METGGRSELSVTMSKETESSQTTAEPRSTEYSEYSESSFGLDSEEDSSSETSSAFTDDEPVVNPSFQGNLVGNEEWLRCPYYKEHTYLSKKAVSHLGNCRYTYMKMMAEQKKSMDIEICRFIVTHHVPVSEMKEHELQCSSQATLYTYLDSFIEGQRASHARQRWKEERENQKRIREAKEEKKEIIPKNDERKDEDEDKRMEDDEEKEKIATNEQKQKQENTMAQQRKGSSCRGRERGRGCYWRY